MSHVNLMCSHANCRHRMMDRSCGILRNGGLILLNVAGQCEMREAVDPTQPPLTPRLVRTTCGRFQCNEPAISTCASCGTEICAGHQGLFIEQARLQDNGEPLQIPYCDICYYRILRTDQLTIPPPRDDYDDPDDPWTLETV